MNELQSFRHMEGWELGTRDGRIGRCHDVLLDDTDWVIRYLVADTRKWLPGRKVLISPIGVSGIEEDTGILKLMLSKQEIENAPPLDTDAPVSRRYEMAFNRHYNWPNYWSGPSIRGPQLYQTLLHRPEEIAQREELRSWFQDGLPEEATHLRSAREILTYHLLAAGEDIGEVDDLLMEEGSWIIRYLVIDSRQWRSDSTRLLISPDWITEINWAKSGIAAALTADELRGCPGFDPSRPIERAFERSLYDFFGMPYYWPSEEDRP